MHLSSEALQMLDIIPLFTIYKGCFIVSIARVSKVATNYRDGPKINCSPTDCMVAIGHLVFLLLLAKIDSLVSKQAFGNITYTYHASTML